MHDTLLLKKKKKPEVGKQHSQRPKLPHATNNKLPPLIPSLGSVPIRSEFVNNLDKISRLTHFDNVRD